MYLARDEQLRRTVALKEIRPERVDDPTVRRRFLAEAEITGRLEHPGIVPIYALEHDAWGRPVYAMRFIQGRTLSDAIQIHHHQPTPLGLHELLQRFIVVCQTMAYAHNQGVIHRDLKPANVMLGAYGETLVVDWGLAKVLGSGVRDETWRLAPEEVAAEAGETVVPRSEDGSGDSDQLTSAGLVLGTPAYMAPEQARGEIDNLGPPADIYALGAVLLEILTGKPPYVGPSTLNILHQVLAGPPQAFTAGHQSIPRPLQAICLRAMARDAAARYPTASELALDVERWLADEPVRAYREPFRARARRWIRRHRTLVTTLSVTGMLLIGGGIGFAWWQQQHAVAAALRAQEEEQRLARNAETVASLLEQCEAALGTEDLERARVALAAAERQAAEGGTSALTERLARCRTDHQLLRDLNATNAQRWGHLWNLRVSTDQVVGRWREAFARAGVTLDPGGSIEEAARQVNASIIRERLLYTFDLWLRLAPTPEVRRLLQTADPSPYRDACRDALQAEAVPALLVLAEKGEALTQSTGFLTALAQHPDLPAERRRQLLHQVLHQRPGDLEVLMALAEVATRFPLATDDGIRWFQAATAVHPRSFVAMTGLAHTLSRKGDLVGAVEHYRAALKLDPSYGQAHLNLGSMLINLGDLDSAMESFRAAIQNEPLNPKVHSHFGYILTKYKQDYVGAEASLREALRLNPDFSQAHAGLGLMYEAKRDMPRAIDAYRAALKRDADYTLVYQQLGAILEKQGDLEEASRCQTELLRISPNDPQARERLDRLQHLRRLLGRLPDILTRRQNPASPEEACQFAVLCSQGARKQYAAATRLYLEAFAGNPQLTSDHRYTAALAAVAGGCGQGNDAATATDRAKLRTQALRWLQEELADLVKHASTGQPARPEQLAQTLTSWLTETEFARLRPGPKDAELSEVERADWDRFWDSVRAARHTAQQAGGKDGS